MRAPEEPRFRSGHPHDVRLVPHRLRLAGELTDLRTPDLRFSLAEARPSGIRQDTRAVCTGSPPPPGLYQPAGSTRRRHRALPQAGGEPGSAMTGHPIWRLAGRSGGMPLGPGVDEVEHGVGRLRRHET
jgi:hypothetical protein